MAEPFLAEIRLFSFNFPPKGWAACDGALLPINQNQALFSLLGTTYGGNGQTIFGLPNLQGRVPMHMGAGFTLGQQGGAETHQLTPAEMAEHTHSAQGSVARGAQHSPANGLWAAQSTSPYGTTPQQAMSGAAVTAVGGNQPHSNMQPYLAINFCIALQGIFPSQN